MLQKLIWPLLPAVTLLTAVAAFAAAPAADEREFESLFNGRDLLGWTGRKGFWTVQDGAITGTISQPGAAKTNTFLVWTNGTVFDFELRFSCRLVADNARGVANAGVQYRSQSTTNLVVRGYQFDLDTRATNCAALLDEGGRGLLARPGQWVRVGSTGNLYVLGSLGSPEEFRALTQPGQWTDYSIVARGNRLTHLIGGRVVTDVVDEHEGVRAYYGIVALELSDSEPMTVQFKNLRLKVLK